MSQSQFNEQPDENGIDIRNLCSWLLKFSPIELSVISTITAILIASELTVEEQAVVGGFLDSTSDMILLISAQELLIQAAMDTEKKLQDHAKSKVEQTKVNMEKQAQINEINDLKKQLKALEAKMNDHLDNTLK